MRVQAVGVAQARDGLVRRRVLGARRGAADLVWSRRGRGRVFCIRTGSYRLERFQRRPFH